MKESAEVGDNHMLNGNSQKIFTVGRFVLLNFFLEEDRCELHANYNTKLLTFSWWPLTLPTKQDDNTDYYNQWRASSKRSIYIYI